MIEFSRVITRDASGRAAASVVEISLIIQDPNGNNNQEVAYAKLDLAQIVRSGLNRMDLPLQSRILDSTLSFDVFTAGSEFFAEGDSSSAKKSPISLPNEKPLIRSSWMDYKHNQDQIELDAQLLVKAMQTPTGS